ncbi:MAG: autotransporter-associated beta strand repeat-containing protein [Kiritimatiellia bacterium]
MNGGTGNARFELRGTTQTLAGIANDLTGRGVIQNQEVSPANAGASTLILNGSGSYAFNGYLRNSTGLLALTKSGAGTQTLSGANITLTGRTQIGQGTLKLLNVTNYVSPTEVAPGAVLEFSNTVAGFASRKNSSAMISGAGDLNITGGGWSGVFGTVAMTGQINVSGNSVFHNDNLTANWSGNTAGLNVAAGSEFHSRGQNSTFGALTGAGKVANDNTSAVAIVTVGMGNGSGTFSGTIQGNGSGGADGDLERGVLALVKTGTGTQVLSGTSTFTGGTTVNGGTLQLDFAAGGTSNILAAGSALALNGGTLEIKGGNGEADTQTFNGLGGTGGTLRLTQNGAVSINATLGAISGAGMINFSGSDATVGALGNLNFLTTTTTTGNNGTTRLGAHLWNGADWASTSSAGGNHLVQWAGSYSDIYNGTSPGPVAIPTGAPAAEVRILEASGGFGNNTLGASETINSLLSAGTTAATVNMGANTLTVGNGAVCARSGCHRRHRQVPHVRHGGQSGLPDRRHLGGGLGALLEQPEPLIHADGQFGGQEQRGGRRGIPDQQRAGDAQRHQHLHRCHHHGGTVEIGGAGQLGGGAYSAGITNAGTLRLNTTANQTITGSVVTTAAGSGSLVKDNTGTLTLNPTGDRSADRRHGVGHRLDRERRNGHGSEHLCGLRGKRRKLRANDPQWRNLQSFRDGRNLFVQRHRRAHDLDRHGRFLSGCRSAVHPEQGRHHQHQWRSDAVCRGKHRGKRCRSGHHQSERRQFFSLPTSWFNLGKGTTGIATLNLGGTGVFSVQKFIMGRDNATSNGVVNMTGGTFTAAGANDFYYLGHVGTATWNQSAGAATFANYEIKTATSAMPTTFNISGGSFKLTTDNWFNLGSGTGLATLNVSGTGAFEVVDLLSARDTNAASKGLVNLSGGSIKATSTGNPLSGPRVPEPEIRRQGDLRQPGHRGQ